MGSTSRYGCEAFPRRKKIMSDEKSKVGNDTPFVMVEFGVWEEFNVVDRRCR